MLKNNLFIYAEEIGLIYLDHWKAWPNTDDEGIKEYLDDTYYPNEQGMRFGVHLQSSFLLRYKKEADSYIRFFLLPLNSSILP
ncbi:hypothetical protein [Cytobacillus purgationiresistens]|uniref:Uncharacterized protein n=1 Tax=Cytobacillus purgationiresistens TaxID=863449 RepID=A0ABU0AD83_9BACI|nr:hypothetical protein [Cytobacillus purgationiresistens]MDQ0269207.1 hypothetical protein [Cytobacillus purgationiresistens]